MLKIHLNLWGNLFNSRLLNLRPKNNNMPSIRFLHTSALTRSSTHQIIRLEPGLIHIKKGVSDEEQKKLTDLILERGNRIYTGFWKMDNDKKTLNAAPHRGRMFDAVSHLPKIFSDICQRNLLLAVNADTTLIECIATHAIILYYQTLNTPPIKGYIPWHQDNGENDGKDSYPIVSFTLGDSCEFLVTHSKPRVSAQRPLSNPENLAHHIVCESGDVIVNGGPSRFIWHSIFNIYKNTSPHFLPLKDARLNITFRYTPELIGKEARFATPQDPNALPKDNPFYQLTKMK